MSAAPPSADHPQYRNLFRRDAKGAAAPEDHCLDSLFERIGERQEGATKGISFFPIDGLYRPGVALCCRDAVPPAASVGARVPAAAPKGVPASARAWSLQPLSVTNSTRPAKPELR
jgi:hypothetical protein